MRDRKASGDVVLAIVAQALEIARELRELEDTKFAEFFLLRP